jgi:leucyl-tRNA synthetase
MLTPGDGYSKELEISMNKTIKKVSEDVENLKFNTAIASMMSLVNDFYAKGAVNKAEFRTFLILLNPVAPHVTEELWVANGFEGMLNQQPWPSWDESKTIENQVEIAIQINGKVKEKIMWLREIDSGEKAKYHW